MGSILASRESFLEDIHDTTWIRYFDIILYGCCSFIQTIFLISFIKTIYCDTNKSNKIKVIESKQIEIQTMASNTIDGSIPKSISSINSENDITITKPQKSVEKEISKSKSKSKSNHAHKTTTNSNEAKNQIDKIAKLLSIISIILGTISSYGVFTIYLLINFNIKNKKHFFEQYDINPCPIFVIVFQTILWQRLILYLYYFYRNYITFKKSVERISQQKAKCVICLFFYQSEN